MSSHFSQDPSCVEAVKLFGDFWTLHIVDAIRGEGLRYSEIQRAVKDISPATLTKRLKKLEDASIIHRTQESRAEVYYHLTSLGEHALPILDALIGFSTYTEN